jgi:hypothetical protein
MTTPFPFVSGAVLTAAQLNAITEVPVSAKTASYTLAATDAGSRITMNSASATTITVNTALFTAGQSLRIQNLNGGGVCTVTAGTATVTSAGPLAIPSWGGGQLYFTSASAAVWFPDAVTTSAGGLVPIVPTSAAVGSGTATFSSTTGFVTVTGASSVSLNGVFTATYNNYFVNLNLLAGTGFPIPTFRVRSAGTDLTTSTYQYASGYINSTTLAWLQGSNSATSIFLHQIRTNLGMQILNINSPFIAQNTAVTINTVGNDFQWGGGSVQNTTSYDGFTITTPSSTLTGTISVFGYNQ